ncbi:MAG: response regulator, partial [Brevundimonas sp.]
RTCGDAMLRLVEDVLEVSRGGDEVALGVADLNALIEEAVAPARDWAAGRGLGFDLQVAPDAGPYVLTDGRRLRQALQHIAGNAAKFTSKGGVRVAVDRVGERLRFVVSDTGCGMGDDLVARIFNLFEQVDPSISRVHEGAGIGLALAKAHIDRLGGTIAVKSAEGHGSTFTLDVPAPVAEAPAEPARDVAEARDDDQPLRVLIVDDHPTNRDLLRIMLQAAGCETQEAADGQEAVDAVTASTFDLVLMDVRMPIVDGLAATRAIRALPSPARDVPILAVTAEAMPEDAARCVAAGMDGHLAKPVTHVKLYEAVETTLVAASERAKVAA